MNIKNLQKSMNISSFIVKLIIWIHLFSWVLTLPLSQLQIFFWGRRIITLYHLGVVECGLLFIILIVMSRKIHFNKITLYTIGLIIILGITGMIGVMINNVPIFQILYYCIYWIIPLFLIIVAQQVKLDIHKLNRNLLIIVVIHAVIILIQRASNSVLWPFLNDEFGNQFFYISEGYYNGLDKMVRSPGICISGLDAGVLLIFGIMILYFMDFKNRLLKIMLTILFLIAIWFTGTRNIYLILIYMFIYINIYKFSPFRLRVTLCNLYMILSSVIYTSAFFVIGSKYSKATRNILTDTLSAEMRINNWENAFNMIKNGDLLQNVFGQFKWQSIMVNIVIDNIYIELMLLGGVMALGGYLIYLIRIQSHLLRQGNESCIFLVSFVSALMVYGVANVFGNIYMSLIIISVLIWSNSSRIERG